MVDAVRTKLDAVLGEVRRSVEYYKTTFREKEIGRTILTGGVSVTKGMQEYCSQSLEGSVGLDAPFFGLSCKEGILEEHGPYAQRFASAVGLALRKA